jgi:hypothetical protein
VLQGKDQFEKEYLNTAKALRCQAKYMFNHFSSKIYICSTIYIEEFYRAVNYLCGKVVSIEGRFESGKIFIIIMIKGNNFN